MYGLTGQPSDRQFMPPRRGRSVYGLLTFDGGVASETSTGSGGSGGDHGTLRRPGRRQCAQPPPAGVDPRRADRHPPDTELRPHGHRRVARPAPAPRTGDASRGASFQPAGGPSRARPPGAIPLPVPAPSPRAATPRRLAFRGSPLPRRRASRPGVPPHHSAFVLQHSAFPRGFHGFHRRQGSDQDFRES